MSRNVNINNKGWNCFLKAFLVFALVGFPVDIETSLSNHGLGLSKVEASVSNPDPNQNKSEHHQHSHDHNSVGSMINSDNLTLTGLSVGEVQVDDEATPCCNLGNGICVTIASEYVIVESQIVHPKFTISQSFKVANQIVKINPHPPRI